MSKKFLTKIFVLVLIFACTSNASEIRKLSPHVTICEGSVNGAFIEKNGRYLVIYGDPDQQLHKADKVLYTHSRRDIVWASQRLVENGAESIVPKNEVEQFTNVHQFWAEFTEKRFHDYRQQSTKILTEPLNVGRAVGGGDIIEWENISIQVIDTPGYTRDSVSYFLNIDGKKYGFVGDLIYGNGQIIDLYSMQDAVAEARIRGYHGYAGRIGALINSLREILNHKPDVLIPARGPVIKEPESSVELLIERLQEVYANYLSINAGHWYFKERYYTLATMSLGSPERVDWMTYAKVVKQKPPDWLIPIRNSRLIVSNDGSGFLIDCGSKAIIAEVIKLIKADKLTGIDGIYITHYHDDHTDSIDEAVKEFGCPVYSCREQTDILENPSAYRLPCLTANPISILTPLAEEHKLRWKEFDLTSYYFPGQTIYHGALMAEKDDGGKIFFIGDSFTPSGIDDYCLLNRNLIHENMGYFYCLNLLKKMPQDYLLVNQHVIPPFRFNYNQLDHMANMLSKRKAILADLFPWNEPNYGIDERWARIYPYGQQTKPGETIEITVKIMNHSSTAEIFIVKPNVPGDCKLEPKKVSAKIEPLRESNMKFRVKIPEGISDSPKVITCDVEFDGWELRHWCESIVEIIN